MNRMAVVLLALVATACGTDYVGGNLRWQVTSVEQ